MHLRRQYHRSPNADTFARVDTAMGVYPACVARSASDTVNRVDANGH
jgi:hypothetical protein